MEITWNSLTLGSPSFSCGVRGWMHPGALDVRAERSKETEEEEREAKNS